MANLLYGDAYSTAITSTQEIFYGQKLSYGYKITLILSTQLLGYSYAGLVRQYLVWPSSMIWPGALVECALLNTLHKNYGKKETKHMSRFTFYFLITVVGAVYYFIPGFLFTALSMFTWVCWIAPSNQTVNSLFGYSTGLGMGFLTFDWSMISWVSSPLVSPVSIIFDLCSDPLLNLTYSGGPKLMSSLVLLSSCGSLHLSSTVSCFTIFLLILGAN